MKKKKRFPQRERKPKKSKAKNPLAGGRGASKPSTQKQFLKTVPRGIAPPPWMQHPDGQVIVKQKFVHQWLFNGWTITSAQAWRSFGITRLADIIWKMRKKKVKIRSINTQGKDRFNKPVHFATYKYISGKRKFLQLTRKTA